LRAHTPGPYTFILRATREVPRRLQNAKRKTIGMRIPDHPITRALLSELEEPMLTTSLIMPGDEDPLNDPEEIRIRLEYDIDLVIDSGACGIVPTTVVDLTDTVPKITRIGKGNPVHFQ